jgi:UDP-glucose 4-epimerase
MKNKKEKVVVTGGAGFIGSHIADALIKEGFEVHVIDNLSNGKEENLNKKVIFHKADICNFSQIKPIFEGAKYVFHEAALPRVQFSIEKPIESNEANVTGTLNVLVCAKDAGVKRVMYAASSSAYGDQDVMPLVEAMNANPKSPYGLQKYIGFDELHLDYRNVEVELIFLMFLHIFYSTRLTLTWIIFLIMDDSYYFPVLPKPPAPRSSSFTNSSTKLNCG